MSSVPENRLRVLIAAVLAVFGLLHFAPQWSWLPKLERGLFATVVGGYTNPPLFIDGNGSSTEPWSMRTLGAKPKPDFELPAVVSLNDDVRQVFQSQPPSPLDFAVLFKNLQRAGVKRIAVADAMTWDASDPIQMKAFTQALAGFEAVAVTTPLKRDRIDEKPPAAYIRASVPVSRVVGDAAVLPTVNRATLEGPALDADDAFAGFSTLESETEDPRHMQLIARWGDRVVLAYPLVAVLVQRGIPASEVKIKLGESIKLGTRGPMVLIDAYGRGEYVVPVTVQEKPLPDDEDAALTAELPGGVKLQEKVIPAEKLLDLTEGELAARAPFVLLRNDRSKASPAERAFSAGLVPAMVALGAESGLGPVKVAHQLSPRGEFLLIVAMAATLVWIAGARSAFARNLGFFITLCELAAAQWIAYGLGNLWLPCLWMTLVLLPVWFFAKPFAKISASATPHRRHNRRVWKWRRKDHPESFTIS